MEIHEELGEIGRVDEMFGEIGDCLGGEIVGSKDVGDDGCGSVEVGDGLFPGVFEGCSVRFSAFAVSSCILSSTG